MNDSFELIGLFLVWPGGGGSRNSMCLRSAGRLPPPTSLCLAYAVDHTGATSETNAVP